MSLSDNDTSSSLEHWTATLIEAPEDPFYPPELIFQLLEPISSVPFHISSPTLSILPREIRDMIYINLIAAGELGILRTSKALFQEASEFLYKRGTLRLLLPMNTENSQPDFLFNRLYVAVVQNLDIRLLMTGVCGRDLVTARLFSGSGVCRRNCNIDFVNDGTLPYGSTHQLHVPQDILEMLGTFTSFKMLTIRPRFLCREHTLGLLQSFKDNLEGSIGEGIWHGRTDVDHVGQYLEFHPRDHWEAQQKRAISES